MNFDAAMQETFANLPAVGFLGAAVMISGWVLKLLIETQKTAAANLTTITAERDRVCASFDETRVERDKWFACAVAWRAQLVAAGITPEVILEEFTQGNHHGRPDLPDR